MDLTTFHSLMGGPLRSALTVLVSALLVTVVAIGVHRVGLSLLTRLANGRPFTTTVTRVAFRSSQLCVIIFGLRMVLAGAPDDTPGLVAMSHLANVALIVGLTWLAMQCIQSLSITISEINPVDAVDNIRARRLITQARVLTRSAHAVVVMLGISFVLLTLPGARQIGASLLASAGVAGLVAGIAARPVLGNFIAGLQIAFSQPIRIDDVLIVNGEWGKVEEIKGTYVVVRVWDERRLIVPLQWFIENPFENWTHSSSMLHGTVFLWLDFSIPLEPLRAELKRICEAAPQWDGRACTVVAFDANERAMRVRFLVSAENSDEVFALRYLVREQMLAFITANYPHGLPRVRATHDPISVQAMQAENDSAPSMLHKA
ncbi:MULTISPECIES: mechanosensitive ion channel family protein [unclassified Janthinobacterium]|uniref:mechanosensitive ion channel family protein n=1 Tax=unclassified Janthinobacterium TaxID=2610881 RepID=UPI00161C03B3|nr:MULTISPECIES: mechanosensitive ion channel domain-containing protein [unclassified Janthinobacterium]MBB5609357.1 small-conductance mechanosensitive channel [Janthinobacterium sp. S3T4]MBB5614530.1 small-conductance mechanosensitive channel [Janthinobacterium sp. S3M3]